MTHIQKLNFIFALAFMLVIAQVFSQGIRNEEPVKIILPTSERAPQEWRYTFHAPPSDWMSPDFDDSNWEKGLAPFGGAGNTIWKTPGIWLRKTLPLTRETLPENPCAVFFHDEDISVYINGNLVLHYPGFTTRYMKAKIRADAFITGNNIIAIHCVQTIGGQAIDFGVIDLPLESRIRRTAQVRVNFDIKASPDLIKDKFNVYNCPYFRMDRWFRDIHLLKELGCSSLRYDPTWGGHNVGIDLNSPQISGTADHLIYNFTDFDKLTNSLLEIKVAPMYVMAYTPQPLQREKGVWGDKPADMDAWQRLCSDYAAHWREAGMKVPFYEIWNEPDNPPFFFRGTIAEYCEIYQRGAAGIKQGDPNALVGGPAIAALNHNDSWLYGFLDYVSSHKLPLDFLSFHNYGDPEPIIKKAQICLAKYPDYAHIPLMMTEYNSFVPLTNDFVEGGRSELHWGAPYLLHDFKKFLNYPKVIKVYWAMFNDPDTMERCGLVSLDGHRKAAFNAFKIYMDMPVPRKKADSDAEDVEVMASCDSSGAGAVIWNRSSFDYITTITLCGIPSNLDILRIYQIDKTHASYYDDPRSETMEPVEKHFLKEKRQFQWNGVVPFGGVAYFTVNRDQ
ncbi:hypothetical protein JW926_09640 [Candidatus Sumerlaeota bacterium]|nr:hypothetical protein [Candidatus Sumerlaeota bacterium]